jgi:hypothetical protein
MMTRAFQKSGMPADDAKNAEVIMGKAAIRFGEVVLRTSKYDAMKSWYSQSA